MARFMVKTSEYKNVCKAVNDRKLAELKKEIIEILKKQDEKEFKKAVDLFESQEMHYSHLEKSITGKWVEKAGYGVGTVRIWKGKKYKKIAPGKWARVFDKEGRGTNIAIGKLIAKVQKIDNVEDLMALVMANKQRFVDENGVDLPVLDKLRAAVDARNNGGMGSNGTSKPAETKQTDYYKDISDVLTKDEKRKINERVEKYSKENEWSIPAVDMKKFVKDWQSALKEPDKHAKAEKLYEIYSKLEDANWHDENKKLLAGNFEYFNDKYFKDMYGEETEESESEKHQNRSDAMKGNKNAYKGDPKDVAKYINGKTNDDEERNTMLLEAFNERYGTRDKHSGNRYAMMAVGELYSKVKQERPHTDEWYDAINNYDEAAEMYKMVVGDNGIALYNSEVEKIRMKPNTKAEKLSDLSKPAKKENVGTFTKVDDKTVEMPADKSTKQLFENLNKSRSKDYGREFMTDCYYDGENIVSTDGMRMTIIKAENIGLDPGYVSVNTDGGKIRLESIDKKGLRSSFPNYKRVIPERNNQEVKLDNKALTEKLKEMKKEGKYSDNKSPQIALNFEDGKVMLDGVQIGTADGVKFDSDRQRMVVNAKYLKDALTSGDVSSMFVSDNPDKAVVIKTDVSDSIVMPLHSGAVEVEYEKNTTKNETETSEKPDIKSMSNDELKDYEEKLEKELLSMDRNSPGYADKYNQWREAHGENNDRFHQRIEDEAKAEKQKESDAKAEKEKEIKEKYNGYFDSRSGLDKARDVKLLEKKYNFDGKVMSQKDFVEQAIDGGAEIKEREVNKLDYPSRTRWNRMNGYEQEQYERRIKEAGKKTVYSINGYEFPKSVVDYAKYYKENGKKGSGEEKSSLSDVAIKNRASSIASAVAYSKTYQEKIGAPFNMEVAESIIDDADDMDEPTKKAVREELKKLYSERKVQKSLDNQFLMDMFVEDEIQKVEEEQEEESLFDDYSAEQPGLFNSTAMKVQEAFNRCKVL